MRHDDGDGAGESSGARTRELTGLVASERVPPCAMLAVPASCSPVLGASRPLWRWLRSLEWQVVHPMLAWHYHLELLVDFVVSTGVGMVNHGGEEPIAPCGRLLGSCRQQRTVIEFAANPQKSTSAVSSVGTATCHLSSLREGCPHGWLLRPCRASEWLWLCWMNSLAHLRKSRFTACRA